MAADTDEIHVGYNEQETYDGRYPPDWDARKEAVKQRNHYTCQGVEFQQGRGTCWTSITRRPFRMGV